MTTLAGSKGLLVGFELEFAIPDVSLVCPEMFGEIGVWPLCNLIPNEFSSSFQMDENTSKKFQALARAAYRSTHKTDYYAVEDVWHETKAIIDPVFLVIILNLVPRKRWLKIGSDGEYIDVTVDTSNLVDDYHLGTASFDEVYEHFHGMHIEVREEVFLLEYRESVLKKLSKDLSELMGVEVKPFLGDTVKDYNSWTLEFEHLVDSNDVAGDPADGFELVSPVLDAADAEQELVRTCIAFKELEQRYGLKTTKGCGFHVNVSDSEKTLSDVSFLHAALREEPMDFSKRFGRTHNGACRPIIQEVKKVIVQLARNGLISAHTPTTSRGVLLTTQLVESMVPGLKSDAFRISSKDRGEYMEYRFAGNKNYHCEYGKLVDYVSDLLRYHESLLTYEEASVDMEHGKQLADMIKDFEEKALVDNNALAALSDIRDIVNP